MGSTVARYKTKVELKRWVGLGVISDNLVNIGRVIHLVGCVHALPLHYAGAVEGFARHAQPSGPGRT
jgi:hypothetical protein